MSTFSITRIISDENGDSLFKDVMIPMNNHGDIGFLSERHQVNAIQFREVEPTYDWNFHTAPNKQYIILLDGIIEIETSLGQKRQFRGGDILLVEDIAGKGHRTRNIQQTTRRSVFILLHDKDN